MLALSLGKNFFRDVVFYLVPMILSLSVHEYAHAWTAFRLGDDTAARQGRLTLSPLAHIDPVGTLLIPIFNILVAGFSFIGWAKPVPVRPEKFRRDVTMRTGMLITSLAGPVSNLLLAVLATLLYGLLVRYGLRLMIGADGRQTGVGVLLRMMISLNLGLFVFNLLPLPPLDGSRLLPRSMDRWVVSVAPYSFVLLMVIINFAPGLISWPVERTWSVLRALILDPLTRGVL